MKKISCIAIDDEPLALGLIVSYIEKTNFLSLKASFDNPVDAMEYMEEHPVQLLFLDIQMPDLTGLEFAETLPEDCKIIFTTAWEKYAIEGFRLHALDYLLKPVSYKVFLEAVHHAKNHFELVESASEMKASTINADNEYLFIKSDYQLKRIEYTDILYFEGLKDYIKLYLESDSKPIVFYATMKSIESKLPPQRFMRIHRSYIVHLDKVKTVERYRILFGEKRIPISEAFKASFDQFVKKNFL